MYEVEYLELK